MAKNPKMSLVQLAALVAGLSADQRAALATGNLTAPVNATKARRPLTFKHYVGGTEQPATVAQFKAAVASGVEAGSVYAHASCSTRAVSAAAVREILAAIGAAVS